MLFSLSTRNCIQDLEYPTIEPILDATRRPFWSVMIPVYNRTQYLERALESVIGQDPGPAEMQIEIVDDCSTGENREQMINVLSSYPRVSLYHQPVHVGMSANWNTCIQRARGRWVHLLHDDDMVLPGFYIKYRQFIEKHVGLVLAFAPVIEIDENDIWVQIHNSPCPYPLTQEGIVSNPSCEVSKENCIVPSAAVVLREAYSAAGGFATSLSYVVDWEMWMRIARTGPLGFLNHPYTLYRNHRGSSSRDLIVTGRVMAEIWQTIKVGVNRLPYGQQREVRLCASRNWARCSDYRVISLAEHKYKVALLYSYWAFRLHPSVKNLLRGVECILGVVKSVLGQRLKPKLTSAR